MCDPFQLPRHVGSRTPSSGFLSAPGFPGNEVCYARSLPWLKIIPTQQDIIILIIIIMVGSVSLSQYCLCLPVKYISAGVPVCLLVSASISPGLSFCLSAYEHISPRLSPCPSNNNNNNNNNNNVDLYSAIQRTRRFTKIIN